MLSVLALENSMARAEYWANNMLTFDEPILPDAIMAEVDAVSRDELLVEDAGRGD